MADWTTGLDIDDDPVAPSISERAMLLVNNHMPEGLHYRWFWKVYDRWLDRPCPSCGLERVEHSGCVMGGCRAGRS
jgi:hypothetical protein